MKSLIKKKNLYEGIGKLPRHQGLQTFVYSWQKECAALRGRKASKAFLVELGFKPAKATRTWEAKIPERREAHTLVSIYLPFSLEAFADS